MSTSATPIYLHYKLRLQSPAIVSTLSGDPNSAATQPFIPGGALRGVMAARLRASGIAGDSEDFRRLILSGDVHYLHAYPELAGERALPSPSSWKRLKDDKKSVHDLAEYSGIISANDEPDDFDWPEEGLATISDPFSAATGSAGTTTAPRIGSRLHQQRDREKGRSWTKRNGASEERRGMIFPYEYLEAEQIFRGAIQVMPAATADIGRIQESLSTGPILIGRSRRAGYGGEATIEFTGQTQREYENVSNSTSHGVGPGRWFRALLVSTYVGRHPTTGQIDPSALQDELCCRLGNAATIERTRWSFEVVGAFNQKWRLEVPQTQAVAAGAVLVLKATSAIPAATLRAIEHEGLGERRVEGFGRILFLEHSEDHGAIRLTRAEDQALAESSGPRQLGPPSEQHRHQLDLLEQRIVLAAARAELDRVAALDLAAKAEGKLPTNSLLGRVRTLFRRAMDEQAAQAALVNLRIWCSEDNPEALKKNAREKLERCKIDKDGLCVWLRKLAEAGPGKLGWESLVQASGNQATLTGLAAKSHLTSPEASEAVLHSHSALLRVHLIDAVLGAMAHLNRRGAR
jgi:CRISPR-associated protein Csx10